MRFDEWKRALEGRLDKIKRQKKQIKAGEERRKGLVSPAPGQSETCLYNRPSGSDSTLQPSQLTSEPLTQRGPERLMAARAEPGTLATSGLKQSSRKDGRFHVKDASRSRWRRTSACDLAAVSQRPGAPPLAVSRDIFPCPESRHATLRVRRLEPGARVNNQALAH